MTERVDKTDSSLLKMIQLNQEMIFNYQKVLRRRILKVVSKKLLTLLAMQPVATKILNLLILCYKDLANFLKTKVFL